MENDDNVIPFPGVTRATQAAADRRLRDRHRVVLAPAVLEDVEEAIADGGVQGLVVLSIRDDGAMHINSTHDRLFTEFVLRSAASRLQM